MALVEEWLVVCSVGISVCMISMSDLGAGHKASSKKYSLGQNRCG